MGIIVRFPDGHRAPNSVTHPRDGWESAQVIVLPVIRIERHPDGEPAFGKDGHRTRLGLHDDGLWDHPRSRKRKRGKKLSKNFPPAFHNSGAPKERP